MNSRQDDPMARFEINGDAVSRFSIRINPGLLTVRTIVSPPLRRNE
jgi:hypothetical protein